MQFIEIEKLSAGGRRTTPLHSHEYYELYFLLDGNRHFFIGDNIYEVSSNTLVVVPPFVLHKTDGGRYMRININVSADLLKKQYADMLKKIERHIAINIEKPCLETILYLLELGADEFVKNTASKREIAVALTETILFVLSKNKLNSTNIDALAASDEWTALMSRIVAHLNDNYASPLTLDKISKEFFISKMSLCSKFKKYMHCTVNEYITRLKLTKAKDLLINSNKSMDKIACECGFSSANYFGLIFKKEMGLSPLNYRKNNPFKTNEHI